MEMYPFRNPDLSREERINDLVERLTIEEKASQLLHLAPAIERLGISPHSWWNEALHGVARAGLATIFPQAIGLGATFNRSLLRSIADAVSTEARAKHALFKKKNNLTRYTGLTFWTPNVNIFRDPRWSRGQETYGEDPYLTGELGKEFVLGLQGEDRNNLKTAACAKHFAVHSGPEEARHRFDAKASPYDLEETYFPAFQKLVETGVESVMGAYNRVNGEPSCGSEFLLNKILRGRWNFKGHVVSDCWAIQDFHMYHKITANAEESAALALNKGCDLNCGCIYEHLLEALKQGMITEETIDRSLKRLFTTRFKLGEFDPPEKQPYGAVPISKVRSKEHIQLSYEAAVQSAVLLKNDGLLPLNRDKLKSIFILGPNAMSPEALVGNYHGISSSLITPLEGIAEAAGIEIQTDFRHGSLLNQNKVNDKDWAVFDAQETDVTIACMGMNILIEGEEGDAIASDYKGDRKDLKLPESQHSFLMNLLEIDKPVILVVYGGSAVDLSPYMKKAAAIIYHWYPGEQGGKALGDLLFGEADFSGKLPVTFPKSTDVLPPFEDYSMKGRTYKYMKEEDILFPFGFGLSYNSLKVISVNAPVSSDGSTDINISVTVENPNGEKTSDVIQIYSRRDVPSGRHPELELVAFERLELEPGTTREIPFSILADTAKGISDEGEKIYQTGKLHIWAGTCQPGNLSESFGSTAPVKREIELK
ncbi:MAG: glycoside hydrolase family 3 C-terminal domain-containing protein [Spirochaetales bacterium]|nr:glycoside hydrolase family 3 C-terminal domain-containing protein [Spirochaetales bacterium]